MPGRSSSRAFSPPLLAAVAACLAGLAAPDGDAGALRSASAAADVRISVRVDARGRGSFTIRGALVDGGPAFVRRAVVNGRLNATETLTGARGRIVLTAQQRCGTRTGTWRVVAGTLAYAQLSGHGTTAGLARCTRPPGRATLVHRGAIELPPPVLAQPGAWGGKTAQASVITFTVTPDGRSITSVVASRYRYECLRSDGQRTTQFSPTVSRFAGPFPIAEDRSFSFKVFVGTIGGRFGAAGAEGTITVATTSPPDIQGQTTTCSGSIAWTATNPPAPPPRALAGTYCGITAAGGGVCLDVPADGRQVRNLRAELKLTCGILARIPVSVSVGWEAPTPFGLDLSYSQSFDSTFEGKTLRVVSSGTFDENGVLLGSVGITPLSFSIERDGATHACRTSGGFTARLQR
ncbi:MAG TPA: hypothetical protein VF073_09495 [Gaiella sp.]